MNALRFRFVAVGLLVALFGAGCSTVTRRNVTATHWHDDDTAYVAYTEIAPGRVLEAKILKCTRTADNALACTEQAEAGRALNH